MFEVEFTWSSFFTTFLQFSQVNVFIACHLSTFNQKEKRGFILPKTFDFLFQKRLNFYWEKKSCSLKVAVPEFQKYRKKYLSIFATSLKNKHEHELFHRYFSVFFCFLGAPINEPPWEKCKKPHSKLIWGEWGITYLIVNKYWGSSYFPVNDYWTVIFSGEYLLTLTPALMLRTA